MKLRKRGLALILAVTLAVSGLPLSAFTARAEEELPATNMRFIQTDFDAASGILTMSLQIKPSGTPVTADNTAANAENVGKTTISRVALVFQADAESLLPLTNPTEATMSDLAIQQEEIIARQDIAVVMSKPDDDSVLSAFLASSGVNQISAHGGTGHTGQNVSFAQAMGCDQSVINERLTAYMVSEKRSKAGTSKMRDYYLQFAYSGTALPPANSEGYVNVIDLKFRLMSGSSIANSTDALFAGSISIPSTAQEAQDILDQFSYTRAGTTVAMGVGGANYVEKQVRQIGSRVVSSDSALYHYYGRPTDTDWVKEALREGEYDGEWYYGSNVNALENSPGFWYAHMDATYILEEMAFGFNVTYATDRGNPDYVAPEDPDFRIPVSGNGVETEDTNFPRYAVPDYEQSQKNDEDESWGLVSYQIGKVKALKYEVATVVTSNSVSSPLTDDAAAFMNSLTWGFAFDDGTPLESAEITLSEGAGTRVPTVNGQNYLVREAVITAVPGYTGTRLSGLIGAKLWVVYKEGESEPFMRTPVGVTLDFVPTEITYEDRFTEPDPTPLPTIPAEYLEDPSQWHPTEDPPSYVRVRQLTAPQLHVSSQATDPTSYIWRTENTGYVLFRPTYTLAGRAYVDSWLTVRLYKDAPVITTSVLDMGNIPESVDGEGGRSFSFWVGRETLAGGDSAETAQDPISHGVNITSTLYDQYGIASDTEFNVLEIVPTAETRAAMTAAKKTELPFQILRQGNSDRYTILYKEGMNANDAMPGTYVFRATYTPESGSPRVEEFPLTIYKPEDRLSYVHANILGQTTLATGGAVTDDNGNPGVSYSASFRVPTRKESLSKPLTASFSFDEVANQWRVDSNRPSTYDIIPGLHTQDSTGNDVRTIPIKRIRDNLITLTLTPVGSVPAGVDITELQNGSFSYDYHVADGETFTVRVTATYQGNTAFADYHFTFSRAERRLEELVLYAVNAVYVPTSSQGTKTQTFEVAAWDQYGSEFRNWAEVEALYPGYQPMRMVGANADLNKDGEKKVYLDYTPGSSSPHVDTLFVEPNADSAKLELKAIFGTNIESNTITVSVERSPSELTSVENLRLYQGTRQLELNPETGGYEVTAPAKNAVARTVTTQITVLDQYFTEMRPVSESNPDGYLLDWSYSIEATGTEGMDSAAKAQMNEAAEERVSFDTATGTLTVKDAAYPCKVSLRGTVRSNYSSSTRKHFSAVIYVVREPNRPMSINVNVPELSFPTKNDAKHVVSIPLTAQGKTQYGDDQVFPTNDLTWELNSITMLDGTVIPKARVNTINTLTMTNRGALTLDVDNVTSTQNIPVSFNVTAHFGDSEEDRDTVDIPITVEARRANTIQLTEAMKVYQDAIILASTGSTQTVTPEAEIYDQYGLLMDLQPVWSVVGTAPAGFTPLPSAEAVTSVQVANAASGFSLRLRASYADAAHAELQLFVQSDPNSVVNRIQASHVENGNNEVLASLPDAIVLPLPGNGSTATYSMRANVFDQQERHTGSPMRWSVAGVTVNGAANASAAAAVTVMDASSGEFRLSYNEEVRDALNRNETVTVTMRVQAVDGAGAVRKVQYKVENGAEVGADIEDTVSFTLALDENRTPVYAVPVVVTDPRTKTAENGQPEVPHRGETGNQVYVEATVYDQYDMPMSADNRVALRMTTVVNTATDPVPLDFVQDENANTGVLTVNYTFTGDQVVIAARPQGLSTERTMTVTLNKGTESPDMLVLDAANDYTYPIPLWGSDPLSNVPKQDNKTDELRLRAEVQSQYGLWMRTQVATSPATATRPVWFLPEDSQGVAFAGEMDTTVRDAWTEGTRTAVTPDKNGGVRTEMVVLEIDNTAVAYGQTSRVQTLQVRTSNGIAADEYMAADDEAFNRTVNVTLTRQASRASYLYIDGVDAAGVSETALSRPSLAEGSASFRVKPVIYDQYGSPMEQIAIGSGITVELDQDALLLGKDNLRVVPVYPETEEGEPAEDVEPIRYRICRVDMVERDLTEEELKAREEGDESTTVFEEQLVDLAVFDPSNGEITAYTACDPELISQFRVIATYSPLGSSAGTKEITVPYTEAPARPTTVEISRSLGEFIVEEGATEPMVDFIQPVIYDQFGRLYTGSKGVSWTLFTTETDPETGETAEVEYTSELGPEGEVRRDYDLLVQKADDRASGTTTLTVYPERFFEEKNLRLECVVYTSASDTSTYIYASEAVTVKRKSKGGTIHSGEKKNTYHTVIFDAGEFGEILGTSTSRVLGGKSVTEIPAVTVRDGYLFLGWSRDGVNVEDVLTTPITGETVFRAVYSAAVLRVSFDATDFGTLEGQAEFTVDYGGVPAGVPQVTEKEGYAFLGWSVDGETLVDPAEALIWTDTVYRAVYAALVQVSFRPGVHGSLIGEDRQLVVSGNFLSEAPGVTPIKKYAFLGWSLDGETVIDITGVRITEPTLFYAVYGPEGEGFTVTFVAGNYGELTGESRFTVGRGQKLSAAIPQPLAMEGYRFLGWSLDGMTLLDPAAREILEDTNFYAVYVPAEDEDTVLVTFVAGNYGSLSGRGLYAVARGARVSAAPAVTAMPGYRFAGWSLDGMTVTELSALTAEEDLTLFAVYDMALPRVLFSAGDYGMIDGPAAQTVDFGATVSRVPEVLPFTEMPFLGWSLDGVTLIDPLQWTIEEDTTFLAVYGRDELQRFTVSFDPGVYGVLEGPARLSVTAGGRVENAPGVRMASGFVFRGWSLDGQTVLALESFPITRDTALVAVVQNLHTHKFLVGYDDGSIRPEELVSRAEFVTFVVRAMTDFDPDGVYPSSFGDVPADSWFAGYIGFAERESIVVGEPGGVFRPEEKITRAEAAKILVAAANLPPYGDNPFTDVPEEAWYARYAAALYTAGVIDAGDGSFRPESTVSRAEAVRLIVMLTDFALTEEEAAAITETVYCPFTDIKREQWYYPYILRAAGIA